MAGKRIINMHLLEIGILNLKVEISVFYQNIGRNNSENTVDQSVLVFPEQYLVGGHALLSFYVNFEGLKLL